MAAHAIQAPWENCNEKHPHRRHRRGAFDLVGVADLSDSQPGMPLVRDKGVRTTDDVMDIARRGTDVDIIIDTTGVPKVRESLRQHFQDSGKRHAVIMHETIVLLMMSLSQGKLVQGKHDTHDYA
jgi:glyceraldehyde-3-phosphate dehydrogenase/erythrose-4-phosphate dehydrogenase